MELQSCSFRLRMTENREGEDNGNIFLEVSLMLQLQNLGLRYLVAEKTNVKNARFLLNTSQGPYPVSN